MLSFADAPGNAAPVAHLVVTRRMRKTKKIIKVAKGLKLQTKKLERTPNQSPALRIHPVILIRVKLAYYHNFELFVKTIFERFRGWIFEVSWHWGFDVRGITFLIQYLIWGLRVGGI